MFNGIAFGQVTEYNLDLKVVETDNQVISDVAYASIYILETEQSLTTNKEGVISLHLEPGTYTIYVSSLGLEEQELTVEVSANAFNLVQLKASGSDLESLMNSSSASAH